MAKSEDKDKIRKIWLAGIGAYGRAFTEAKGAVDSLSGKSSEVFEDLVQKGEMLEMVGKYKAEELLGKGKAAAKDMTPDFDIDDRIARMRARLSGGGGESGGGDSTLAARVDQLEAKLDAILEQLDIGDAPKKTRAKKAPTRKAKTPSKKRMTTDRVTATKAKPKPKPAAKKTAASKAKPKPKPKPKK